MAFPALVPRAFTPTCLVSQPSSSGHVRCQIQRESNCTPFCISDLNPPAVFCVLVSCMFCGVHPKSHSRHLLGQDGSVGTDRPGSYSSKLQHRLLEVAPASAVCLPAEKHGAVFKYQFAMQLLERLGWGYFSDVQVFGVKFVHCVSLCYHSPLVNQCCCCCHTHLAPMYCFLFFAQCTWISKRH